MAIPKKIHYCWFGGADIPEDVLKCINSWKKYCPDYEIIRWDETNYDYNKYRYSREAYEHRKWAFVSDVARLDIIYNHGGIYLDTDVELVKSLDFLLEEAAFMGFQQGRIVNTGLGFGAEQYNELIGKNLEIYCDISFIREDGSLDLTPCPDITTKVLEKHGLIREDRIQKIEDMKILSSVYLSPMLLSDGNAEITDDTVSIHHYAGTWTTDEEKRAVMRRRKVYTKFGRKGLRIYDAFVLLRTHGWRAVWRRSKEIICGK